MEQKLDIKKYNKYLAPSKKKERSGGSKLEAKNDDQDFRQENMALLDRCQMYWSSLQDFRDRRERNRKYYRGDQWHELIVNDAGETVTEEDYILEQGRMPVKQNIIRQLVRSLLGQYRSNPSKSIVIGRTREDAATVEMLTNALQAVKELNQCKELDARNMEEFMLSGFVCEKIRFAPWKELDKEDVFITPSSPVRSFFNTELEDIRMIQLNLIGEIIDEDLDTVISTFADTKADEEYLRDIFKLYNRGSISQNALSPDRLDSMDFFVPGDDNKVRLFEVWRLEGAWRVYAHDYLNGTYKFYPLEEMETLELENQHRIEQAAQYNIAEEDVPLIELSEKFDRFWKVSYLLPTGHCLYEGETSYKHDEHPYVLTLFPLLDGEVWGLVEDIIDQQRYINRLISMLDFIIGTSAKGVLLVPEGAIPETSSPEEFASEWTKMNGVIVYTPKPGVPVPQQISSNSTNVGAHEMLSIQMNLANQLSGVSQAIQGQSAKSGTPSSLYAQEAQNSSMNSRDMFDTFANHIRKRDLKALKVLGQFYTEQRYLATSGKSYAEEAAMWDPDKVEGFDFDLVVAQGTDTPVYRTMIDDTLMKLLDMQAIDATMYLENSSLPFADKILDAISRRNEEMTERNTELNQDPEIQASLGQADPMMNQMMGQQPG